MKKLLIIGLAIMPLLVWSQEKGTKKFINKDSLNYDEEYYVMKKDPSVKHGEYKKMTKKGIAFEKGYFKNGKRDGKWTIKMQGDSRFYAKGSYAAGKKVGQWTYYYDSQVDQVYDHTANKVISSKREKGKLDYIGGRTLIHMFIEDNLIYNESAKTSGIKGKVYISFDVNVEQEVKNVVITKGVHDLLDVEAMRIVRFIPPRWILPSNGGELMKGSFEWVINFGSR
jgi:hypothetical protein